MKIAIRWMCVVKVPEGAFFASPPGGEAVAFYDVHRKFLCAYRARNFGVLGWEPVMIPAEYGPPSGDKAVPVRDLALYRTEDGPAGSREYKGDLL